MKDKRIYLKILVNLLLFTVICIFLIFVFPRILVFFMPFVIGLLIAAIANPLVRFLEKKVKIVRKHSSAIIIVLVIAAVIGMGYLVISFLGREIMNLVNDWSSITEQITSRLEQVSLWLDNVTASFPVNISNVVDDITAKLVDYVSNISTNAENNSLQTAGNLVNNIADKFVLGIMSILSAYFFIAQRDELINGIKKIVPDSIEQSFQVIYTQFKLALGGYFKAQFKIMCIITLIIFIGLEIFQVNYSLFIAFGIAFLDLLPFFGTGAVLWPWAIVEFITGNYVLGIGLLVIYLVCQIIKQVLQPKMVGDSIGISPFATLVFMFIGYRVKGVLGLIFGIPIGMVLVSFYKNGMFDGVISDVKEVYNDINNFRKLR